MNRLKEFFIKIKPSKRKLAQLYFALLFNANLKGFSTGNIYQGNTKKVCVPGINCYSCPGAVGACPIGSLQGSFSADKSTVFYVGGILLLYCILFGRLICGWLCPFGLIQELLYKIKTPKLKKGPVTRVLSFFKYIVLVFFVFIVPVTYAFRDTPLPAFCKYICPAGTFEGGIMLLSNKVNESYFAMLGPLFTWKFLLLISISVACVFIFRMFCRFICPLGALYGLFNRISVFGVKIDAPKCTNCGMCVNHCKMDIKKVGDAECIACGECVDVCPTKAIVWKGIGKKRAPSEGDGKHKKARLVTRLISVILMLALLVGAVVYYWNLEPRSNTLPEHYLEGNMGNEVGDLCYEAELNIITPDGITEEKISPTKSGKINIINFWGTWCTPCVNELPYFGQIATEYKDTVSVVAIHTQMICDTAPEYIGNYYSDSDITFACDLENEGYYSLLGGRGAYPYTIITDENGVITNVFVEALHYEDLKNAVDAILAD